MNPLSLNRKWLTWLCVYPIENDASRKKKIACVAFALTVILVLTLALIASVVFFLRFVSNDLEGALYALSFIIGFSACLYIVLIAFIKRQKIVLVFSDLAQIYDSSKYH